MKDPQSTSYQLDIHTRRLLLTILNIPKQAVFKLFPHNTMQLFLLQFEIKCSLNFLDEDTKAGISFIYPWLKLASTFN